MKPTPRPAPSQEQLPAAAPYGLTIHVESLGDGGGCVYRVLDLPRDVVERATVHRDEPNLMGITSERTSEIITDYLVEGRRPAVGK